MYIRANFTTVCVQELKEQVTETAWNNRAQKRLGLLQEEQKYKNYFKMNPTPEYF